MSTEAPQTRLVIPALAPLYGALSRLSYPMIRFFAGLFLVPHGAQKLFGWFGGGGLQGTAEFFATGLGLEPGMFFAVLVGATEFFGGLMLAVGFLTRPAAVAATILLAVAVSGAEPTMAAKPGAVPSTNSTPRFRMMVSSAAPSQSRPFSTSGSSTQG